MVEVHKISITPRGTLTDIVESIFRGDGTSMNIGGREYTLREYGTLPEHDPIRKSMLLDLKYQARVNPYVRCSTKVKLGNQPKKIKNPTLKIRFTRAEEIPKVEEDIGNHQYMIVEGARYKLDVEG